MSKKLISIVLPAFNEEDCIKDIYEDITKVFFKIKDKYDYEIIFINDGSIDNTWQEITKICEEDKFVIGLDFSRNFGKEIALTAGVEKASGNAVITMDVDGQHPVSKLLDFIEKWEEGYDVIYNIRSKINGVSFFKKITSKLFYILFNTISNIKLEPGTTDYRLLDREVVRVFLNFTERNRLYRGIVDMIGYNKYPLEFDALPNKKGRKPSYTYLKLYELAINSLTSFSIFPLKLVGYIGLLITLVSSGIFVIMIVDKLGFLDLDFTNLALVVVINTILIGIVLMSLGFMALYIARIHEEVIGRPLYIIKNKINLK